MKTSVILSILVTLGTAAPAPLIDPRAVSNTVNEEWGKKSTASQDNSFEATSGRGVQNIKATSKSGSSDEEFSKSEKTKKAPGTSDSSIDQWGKKSTDSKDNSFEATSGRGVQKIKATSKSGSSDEEFSKSEKTKKTPGTSDSSIQQWGKKSTDSKDNSFEATSGRGVQHIKATSQSASNDEEWYKHEQKYMHNLGITSFSGRSDRISGGSSSSSAFSNEEFASSFSSFSQRSWNSYSISHNKVLDTGRGFLSWLWQKEVDRYGRGTCSRFDIDLSYLPMVAITQDGDGLSVFDLQSDGSSTNVIPYGQTSTFNRSVTQKSRSQVEQSNSMYCGPNGCGFSFKKSSEFQRYTQIKEGYRGTYYSIPSNRIPGAQYVSLNSRKVCVNGQWIIIFENQGYRPMLCAYNNVRKLVWFEDCNSPIKHCVPAQIAAFGY